MEGRTFPRHFTWQFLATELRVFIAVTGGVFIWGPVGKVGGGVDGEDVVEDEVEVEVEDIVVEGGGKIKRPGASSWIWLLMMWQFERQVGRSIFCAGGS